MGKGKSLYEELTGRRILKVEPRKSNDVEIKRKDLSKVRGDDDGDDEVHGVLDLSMERSS